MNNSLFGLLGFPLTHSFSKGYFTKKFEDLGLKNHHYAIFAYQNIDEFYENILKKTPTLVGFNVTIPHKIAVMDYLDALDETAQAVGAVNTVVRKDGKWIGYNTDICLPLPAQTRKPDETQRKALLLGTGGASKAVIYVLKKENLGFLQVSRQADAARNIIDYDQLKTMNLADFQLIINTTPLGMVPNITTKPDLNYAQLTENNFLLDLVYNPTETAFLREGLQRNCGIQNGLPMLYAQADAAWDIWNQC